MALKFPDPKRCTIEHMVVFCSSERIIRLYNQSHTLNPKERIVESVKAWFTLEARKKGWAGTKFLPSSDRTSTIAGCVLAAPPHENVHIHLKVIEIDTDALPDSALSVVSEVPKKRLIRRPRKG
jgi:hypothetical protein